MKYLMTALFISASPAFAAPQIEFPGLEASACLSEAGRLMERYTEIFDLGRGAQTIRFETFRNTTPGSYDQEYEANVTLDQTRLHVTFRSPFICDDLKILKIKNRGLDKNDPLYVCLHDTPKLDPLQKAEIAAFDVHLKAMNRACETVPFGAEKLQCFDAWHQTAEGKALFDALKAAQKAVSDYDAACYAAYPKA